MRTHLRRFAAPFVPGLAALCAAPALAGQTTFDPSLEVGSAYHSNIGFIPGSTASDRLTAANLHLPVRQRWDRGSFDFLYRPSLVRYAEFDELDRDDHHVSLGLLHQSSPLSRATVRGRYERTQAQGDPTSVDDPDLFVAPRENRNLLLFDASYGHALGRRWSGTLSLGGSNFHYTPILDGLITSQDRTEYRGTVQVTRLLSPLQQLGLQYAVKSFDFEVDPDLHSDSVRGVWAHQLDRDYSLEIAAGAYRLSGKVDGLSADRTGVDAYLRLRRKLRAAALALELRNEPSSGGNLEGTSITSVIGFVAQSSTDRTWGWSAASRYARRDPLREQDVVVSSLALDSSVSYRVIDGVRLRLEGRYLTQAYDAPGDAPDGEDLETWGASLAVLWNPLDGTRLAEK